MPGRSVPSVRVDGGWLAAHPGRTAPALPDPAAPPAPVEAPAQAFKASEREPSLLVGLIADTHGLVRPGCHAALQRCVLILHAGDVGGRHVLDELSMIAPVLAVAGNTDDQEALQLPWRFERAIGGVTVSVSHGHEVGSPTPDLLLSRSVADIVVFGHTHRPLVHRDGRRLVVNPGAAGPSRCGLRPSVARLTLRPSGTHVEVVPIT